MDLGAWVSRDRRAKPWLLAESVGGAVVKKPSQTAVLQPDRAWGHGLSFAQLSAMLSLRR